MPPTAQSATPPDRTSPADSGAPPVIGVLPALVAVLFAFWAGSYHLGASATGAAVGHIVLLGGAGFASTGRERWWDPLRLDAGRSGGGALLPCALLAAVALAWWLSPVARAGRVGVALLPALLLLPAAVDRAWSAERARRAGLRALSVAVAAVAGWSLAWWLAGGAGELPALPLGHHLFLVVWLVALAPLAAAPAWLPDAHGPGWRLLAGAAGGLAAVAIVATRSLVGIGALALQAALLLGPVLGAAVGGRRRPVRLQRRAALALVAVLGLAAVAAVGLSLLSGDPSLRVRPVYWRAGWEGVLERPVTGLGPGATAWTSAELLRPVPGLNPVGEVVGDLHLLPLAVAYEAGLPALGLAMAVVALFWLRRRREVRTLEETGSAEVAGVVRAGLAGLAGVGLCGLGVSDWRVVAWPVAAAVAAGAAMAGSPVLRRVQGRERPAGAAVYLLYLLVAGSLLVPVDLGHWWYERGEVGRAAAVDPEFPLYRFQGVEEGTEEGALEALAAAEAGHGVAALWLRAGAAAHAAGLDGLAAPALERACALDPLAPLAPLALLEVGSPLHRPEALGARALAAEPRLAAALLWEDRPELYRRVLAVLAAAEGLDPGWREEMIRRARSVPRGRGEESRIAAVRDQPPASFHSFSLQAFRRLPRRVELAPVPVRAEGAEWMGEVPPATLLPETDRHLFPPTCLGPFAPQRLRKTLWKSL